MSLLAVDEAPELADLVSGEAAVVDRVVGRTLRQPEMARGNVDGEPRLRRTAPPALRNVVWIARGTEQEQPSLSPLPRLEEREEAESAKSRASC